MITNKIQKLEELLTAYINKDCRILTINITNLTAPGENYGSEISKIDVEMENKHGEIEQFNVVAKQIPESEYYQKVFNVRVTFNMEKEFYTSIVPLLHKFQKENGMDILDVFPKCFGGRSNLYGFNNVVDKDAVLILENLKTKGYMNVDRYVGFDLPTTKFLLKVLAQFHAVTLALKLKQPKTFEQRIKPHCACFLERQPPPDLNYETNELLKLVNESKVGYKLAEGFKRSMSYMSILNDTFREPFATIIHRDFWVNNIMIKCREGVVSDVKIVDFQTYTYDSPAADLMFFLSTSVETEILKQHFDDLLNHYHEVLLGTLSNFGCNVEPFSFRKFLQEITDCLYHLLGRIVFLLVIVVRGPKGGHLNKNNPQEIPKPSSEHFVGADKDRLFWLLEEFDRRGWTQF